MQCNGNRRFNYELGSLSYYTWSCTRKKEKERLKGGCMQLLAHGPSYLATSCKYHQASKATSLPKFMYLDSWESYLLGYCIEQSDWDLVKRIPILAWTSFAYVAFAFVKKEYMYTV
jgi:hypothetical protein